MSVLNFPRIYLNGHMFWNPPTANNNDVFPLYDAVNADINWPFMEHFDINCDNAPTQLMPWVISPLEMRDLPTYVLQVPGNSDPLNYPYMPAEWDLFGDNACGTVNYGKDIHSRIIGGELQANTYIDQDPLVDKPYQLFGNPLGSSAPTAARFVDISPWQNTFTALYFDKLVLGDATRGLTLNRKYRMMDRFLNFKWAALGGLVHVTTTWQTCFPKENLEWVIGDSSLLFNLQQQMQLQGAQGLMFRFSTYLTCYDRNGVFNDFTPNINTRSHLHHVMGDVRKMYKLGLDNVANIFSNPAYSRTAATLGLWLANEYPTAPAGRRLVPNQPVSIFKTNQEDTQSVQLGVISAQITGDTLSLDLSNTFPCYPVDPKAHILTPEKFHAGNYKVGARNKARIATVTGFNFEQYRQSAFDKRSGILDLTLPPGAKEILENGSLILQQEGSALTAAEQQAWTAEVIESGSFIDVGERKTLSIMVQLDGKPAASTTLLVAEYGNPYMVTSSDYYLAFSNAADFTLFYDDPTDRKNNMANLPQFTDARPVSNYRSTGSGRRLTALQTGQPSGNPIGYQEFLHGPGKPIAVDLRPCLAFDKGTQVSRTLNNSQASKVEYSYVAITTDAKGIARLNFRAVAPGFPTLRFFVQQNTPSVIPFSFPITDAYTDFLAPIRVLPVDLQLQQEFIDKWNSIYKDQNAPETLWNDFIYPRILQTFYYLYPIMNKFMPLNSQKRVEGAIDQLIVLISKPYQDESTLAMPITRDMSQSRRAVLELWATALVKLNYPPKKLSMSDYDS
ncbi:hypothetical protein [Pseudomonas sp. FEN]|uniref:hypothetical protein n=1 Tax=Pseudomonas sp. FEN TaxID=2767468 RepID=UPI00174A5504|nr:hypothetical protein [Pseudomonas sp. FEN]